MDSPVEQFYSQTSESIKLIFDLTSRIDEKIGKIIEKQENIYARISVLETVFDKQNELDQKIHQIFQKVAIIESKDIGSNEDISDLETEMLNFKQRIQNLEIKIESIFYKTTQHEARWSQILDLIFKLILMLTGGFLLYKLGWQSPPS